MKRIVSWILCLVLLSSIMAPAALALDVADLRALESAGEAVSEESEEDISEPETDPAPAALPADVPAVQNVEDRVASGVVLTAETESVCAVEAPVLTARESVIVLREGVSASAPALSAPPVVTLIQLMKYMLGEVIQLDITEADINRDKAVNLADVIHFLRNMAEDSVAAPLGREGWYDGADGCRYYYDENGEILTESWVQDAENWYYLGEDGAMVKGDQEIDGESYYFWPDGSMHTGWLRDGDYRYYYKADGTMAWSEWVEIDGIWRFFHQDGFMCVGVWTVDDEVYLFLEDGSRYVGWLNLEDEWYYFWEDGTLAWSEWLEWDGDWYFFDEYGVMLAGGIWYIDDYGYYFQSDGTVYTGGWLEYEGDWYYCQSEGEMIQGDWLVWGGDWYFFDGYGVMLRGDLYRIGEYVYYFHEDGTLAISEMIILGQYVYFFDYNGRLYYYEYNVGQYEHDFGKG